MRAMLLQQIMPVTPGSEPLVAADLAVPEPSSAEALIRVHCCAVCHTELDEIEGRLPPPQLPVVPGHQVVGEVIALGPDCRSLSLGQRVGVAWIFSACGQCEYCVSGQENLCPDFVATGRDVQGGYAEFLCVPEAFAFPLPDQLEDEQAAPLLCAGAIGYRSLRLSGLQDGQSLGLTGFGASAHLVLAMVRKRFPAAKVFVFARSAEEREFALSLGAHWAGDTSTRPPELLHCIIDTTPAWKPIIEALACLKPGGRLVINAIRKESNDQAELQRLSYPQHLWLEKEVKSVANVTRRDVTEFLALAASIPLQPQVQIYPLEQANQALCALKHGHVRGAKVLRIAT